MPTNIHIQLMIDDIQKSLEKEIDRLTLKTNEMLKNDQNANINYERSQLQYFVEIIEFLGRLKNYDGVYTENIINVLIYDSKRTPGANSVVLQAFFYCLAIISIILAIHFSTSLCLILFAYLAVNFIAVGTFLFGIHNGISLSLYELANQFILQNELNTFVNQTQSMNECMKIISKSESDFNGIPFLKVLQKIENAQDATALKSAKKEFDAIRPWTYWGLFPLKKESVELEVVTFIETKLNEKINKSSH